MESEKSFLVRQKAAKKIVTSVKRDNCVQYLTDGVVLVALVRYFDIPDQGRDLTNIISLYDEPVGDELDIDWSYKCESDERCTVKILDSYFDGHYVKKAKTILGGKIRSYISANPYQIHKHLVLKSENGKAFVMPLYTHLVSDKDSAITIGTIKGGNKNE